MIRRGLSAWLALSALAGCESVQMPTLSAPRSGLETASAARPASGAAPARQAGTSAENIKVGRDTIALSSFEGDIGCTRLVAPFEASDNVMALTGLATTSAVSAFGKWLDSAVKNRSTAGVASATAAQARHNIPYEVRTTALRMNWLPMQAEVLYGESVLQKMDEDLLQRDSLVGRKLYPEADKLLQEVLAGIGEPHAYNFRIYVRKGAGENATALPGGLLIIDAALVREPGLRNKAYFALSHEVSHVLQRHETRAVQARIIDMVSLRGTVQDLISSIRSVQSDPAPLINLAVQGKLQFEKHSSNQELNADGCAVRILDKTLASNARLVLVVNAFTSSLVVEHPAESKVETPPAARATTTALSATTARIDKTAEDVQGLITVVSRPVDQHPAPKERIDNLNRIVAEVAGKAVLPQKTTPAPGKGKTLSVPAPPAKKN